MPYLADAGPGEDAQPVDFTKAFTDFDGWRAGLSEAQRSAVDERFRMTSADKLDSERKRFLGVGYVASTLGHDVEEVSNHFEDYYVPGFAKSVMKLGETGIPKDAGGFFDAVKGKLTDDQNQQAIALDMGDAVTKAALLNDKTAWQPWKEKAQTMPGWKAELEGQLFSVWRDSESKLKADMGENAALIRRTVESLQSKTGVEGNAAEWTHPEYDLRELLITDPAGYKKALRLIGRVATVAAKDNKEGVLGWFQKAGESLARGVEGIGEGFVADAQRGASAVAGVVGAEDTAKLNDASIRVARDLRDIANGVVDPVKRNNWLDTMIFGGLESAPSMVAGMAGPLNAGLVLKGQYASDAEKAFEEHGWTGAGSKAAAQAVGVAAAAVESMSEMFGATKWGKAAMKAIGAGPESKFATRYLVNSALRGASEFSEELVQDNLAAATQSMLNAVGASVGAPAPFMEEVSGWIKTQGTDTALVVLPLALLGAGLTTSQEIGEAKANAIIGDVSQTAKLIGREAAERVAAISDPQARAAEFQKAYQSQSAKDRQEWLAASSELEKAKAEFAQATNTEAEAQALSITHDESGWRLNMADGGTVRVDSAQAAVSLRKDLMQARTEDEALALVSVVEDWQKNAPADTKRETNFTGEQVRLGSDGQLIGERAGGDVRVIDSPKLLQDIRSQAQSTGLGAEIDLVVNGSNSVFAQSVNEASRQIVQRLEINRSNEQAPIITVLHEQLEANLKAANLGGVVSTQETMSALARVADALPVADAQQRLASLERRKAPQSHIEEARRELDLRQRIQAIANGEGDEAAMREIAVELAVADVIARDKSGMKTGLRAGSVSAALDSAISKAVTPGEVRALGKFRAFLRSVRAWVRSVLGTVAGFQKARRDGKLTDGDAWNAWLDKVTGVTEQARYDQELADELKAIAGQDDAQYSGPGEGQAFSLSRAVPADTSNVTEMPDGARLVGPTTFSITAYHGTPHKVDRFSLDKIGTGEGAQAYGWGLYFAESETVADSYRRVNLPVREFGAFSDGTGKFVVDRMGKQGQPLYDLEVRRSGSYRTTEAAEKAAKAKERPGNLYTVELLPDESEFLDWDKPLSEQSEKVKAALKLFTKNLGNDVFPTGGAIYSQFITSPRAEKQASEKLASLGIPGIRYLDGGSRGKGDGTRNYVIFDDKLVKILEENGKPVEARSFSLSRVTPAQDAEYMRAVESGDMDMAQRMVDEAAKAAGYDVGPVFHGSRPEFGEFFVFEPPYEANARLYAKEGAPKWMVEENDKLRAKGPMFWFATDEDSAASYADGGDVRRFFLNGSIGEFEDRADAIASLQRGEFTLVQHPDTTATGRIGVTSIVARAANQIKSADPVTYDSAGNVIPLSQRFNPADDRITFSLSPARNLELVQSAIDSQLSRAVPADASNVVEMPDGAQLVGPTTFSITAYHGTPHKVDRFSLDKIGTGEGAQAYGWGLYFAESRDVARSYRDQLQTRGKNADAELDGYQLWSPEGIEWFKLDQIHNEQLGKVSMSEWLETAPREPKEIRIIKKLAPLRKRQLERIKDGRTKGAGAGGFNRDVNNIVHLIRLAEEELHDFQRSYQGNLYTVELLPDESEFLDWDKPLSEQSEKVRLALPKIGLASRGSAYGWKDTLTMGEAYRQIAGDFESDKKASAELSKAGIPGIRYLDGGSRGAGDGTRNYVLFDDKLVKILAENGKPVEARSFSLSRVTPAQDAEYLAAVEAGDMEKAQRMVDDAAKGEGPFFHRSGAKGIKEFYPWTNFGTEEQAASVDLTGRSDGDSQTYKVYLDIRNPLRVEDQGMSAINVLEQAMEMGIASSKEYSAFPFNQTDEEERAYVIKVLKSKGYDGLVYENKWEGEGDSFVAFNPSQIKSADPVTYDDAGNVIPLSQRFNPADDRITFSLSPARNLELVQSAIDSQLSRDPDKRLQLAAKAKSKLEALRDRWESEGWTAQGGYKRAIVEKRSKASLDSEQAVRQALRVEELVNEGLSTLSPQQAETYYNGVQKLEDHPLVSAMLNDQGRLMSRTTAEAQGKLKTDGKGNAGDYDTAPWLPPSWYRNGGGIMPSEMAQALYNDGKLNDTTPDALWSALSSVIESHRKNKAAYSEAEAAVKAIEKAAKDQAKAEAQAWRDEYDARQSKDWNPRAALVRDLQLLDSVLSVMPPEVRGKVGGFVKLAQLATEDARVNELQRRVSRMDTLLEDYLAKEYRERIDKLLEKAAPKMKPGEKPKGSMAADAHRLVKLVRESMAVSEEAMDERRAAIEKAMAEDAANMPDLLERSQVLEMFGGFDSLPASELAAAHDWLAGVVASGRNRWKIVEEARLAEQKARAKQLKADTGKSGDPVELQNAIEAEKTIAKTGVGLGFSLISFPQTVRSLFGDKSEVGRRLINMARRATSARTDAIIQRRIEFKAAMRSIFGTTDQAKIDESMWEHSQVTGRLGVTVKWSELTTKSERVPRDVVERLMEDRSKAKALGFTTNEVDELERAWLDPENDGKSVFVLDRMTEGPAKDLNLSQMQAIHLLMMATQKPETLARHGYTADVLDEIEGKLTNEAKSIRAWLLGRYRDGYQPLNAVFQRMYGAPLPQISGYSPMTFEGMQDGGMLTPEGGSQGFGGMSPGALKTRRNHNAKPRLEDALAVYWSHAIQTEHFTHFAEVVRDMRATLLQPDTRAAVQVKAGVEGLNALKNWVHIFENDGMRKAGALTAIEKLSSKLQSAVSISALAWNVGTMVKQSLAALGALYKMPTRAYLRGLSRVLSGKIDIRPMWESAIIRRRVEAGATPELRQVMAGYMAEHPGKWSRRPREFVNYGMELLGKTDGFFTAISAAIYHDHVSNEMKASGMGEAEAAAMAMRETESMIGDTAQPVELMDRSLFEAGNAASPNARWLFMFASESRQKTALYGVALHRIATGRGTKQDARIVLISHVIAPLMFQTITNIIRDARSDDDDEVFDMETWSPMRYLQAMAMGPLSGLPLIQEASNPMLDMIQRSYYGIKGLFDDKKDAEPIEKGIKAAKAALNAVSLASIFPGLKPLEWLGAGANGVGQLFDWLDNLQGKDKKGGK